MGGIISPTARVIRASADQPAPLEEPEPDQPREVEKFTSVADNAFENLVENNTEYDDIFEASHLYAIYINRMQLHWYLLVKLDESELPFVTFEIVIKDGVKTALVCVQNTDKVITQNLRPCTKQNTTLKELCSIIDINRNQMGRYNPQTQSSQQFCNAVLGSFKIPASETNGDDSDFDDFNVVTASLSDRLN